MKSADTSMREYYAARAPIYDEVYLRPERQADLAELRQRIAVWFAGRGVLEVACGTGWWTQFIAPAAAQMTAFDALAEPLAFARLRPGVERVAFVQADAYDLPESLGRFDAAFAGLWLSHVPLERSSEFFAGLHARLDPGARVVLIDNTEAQCELLPIVERDANGNSYQLRTLPDGTTHRVLKNFPPEAALRSMIGGVGANAQYWRGDHFWAFCYDAASR
ncbi:MAG: methyltransferase domain-containing protein [Burkholderiales bacterium]|nr:methyltransferase domain-containing protein [Burkholderiales bacterium]